MIIRTKYQIIASIILSLIWLLSCVPVLSIGEVQKIRIALFLDKGAHARPQVFDVLSNDQSVHAEIINGNDIRNDCLKHFDALFMPGGSGKKEALSLESDGKDAVRKFVKDGGIYVGVCAGCYLASCARPEYLGLIPATTVDKEHWRRGKANLPIQFTDLGMKIFGMNEPNTNVVYHNGPVLKIYRDYQNQVVPLCYFRGEAVANGGTPGLMINAPAVVLCRYGSGLVLGISPHPEGTPGLTTIELNAIHWLFNNRAQSTFITNRTVLSKTIITEPPYSTAHTSDHSTEPQSKSERSVSTQSLSSRYNKTLSQEIYNKAEDIFEHVTSSHYEHLHDRANDQVQHNGNAYSATTDCSGFISYVINSVAPNHYAPIYEMSGRTYPHAKTYATFFRELPNDVSEEGWLKICSYKDLHRGDIIAWQRIVEPNENHYSGSGHVMIVIDPPTSPVTDILHGINVRYTEVFVLDSSSVEHFPPQQLPPLTHQSSRDGIGRGIIRLMLDEQDNVIGFWEGTFSHEKNKAIQNPSYTNKIGFARLISLIH